MTPSAFRNMFVVLKKIEHWQLVTAKVINKDGDETMWWLYEHDIPAFILALEPVRLARFVRLVASAREKNEVKHQCEVPVSSLTGPHKKFQVYRERQAKATGFKTGYCMKHGTMQLDGKWYCTQHGTLRGAKL